MTASSDQTNSLHVEKRGSGLPVVAIHGYGVDHRVLLPLDEALASVGGIERYYLDLPGFGQSPALPEPGGLQELADSLAAHLHATFEDRPFALLAHSLGGLLARYVRSQMPDHVVGMAFIAPAIFPDSNDRKLPEHEIIECDDALLATLPEKDRDQFTELASRQNRTAWELFREFSLPGIKAADSDAAKNLNENYILNNGEPDEKSGPFSGPALMLTGRQDQIVGFEDQFEWTMKWYPHATYVSLNGAGHNVHFDCPDVSRALIKQWAQELPH